MLIKYFYDETLAQASYLVGCAKTGEAMVVDPARDIGPYLRAAEREGLRITHVTETHIHADFASGLRELAARTGATARVSDEGGPDWKYAFADEPGMALARGGDSWQVGNIRVEVAATSGHTPEHLAFIITDTVVADAPIGIFTGDFIFAGDVGRPDLLEEAAGMRGTKEVGARQLFASLARFKALPDYLQIWPGHGAGSACGKALGAIPSTTLGYEKRFNPAFRFDREDAFVEWLLAGQPEAPRYFGQMKRMNKLGWPLLRDLPEPEMGDADGLRARLAEGAQVFDLRPRDAFARSHASGAISVPMTENSWLTWVGWFYDYAQPAWFVLPGATPAASVLARLRSIGIDDVAGFFAPEAAEGGEALPVWTAQQVADRLAGNALALIDVRGRSEWEALHARAATHIPAGLLPRRLDALPRDRVVVTQCAGGYRAHIAASYLRRQGFDAVALGDGESIWSKALPLAP